MLIPMAVVGGLLGCLLILGLTGTASGVIDAGIQLDLSVIAFFNQLARRSWTVDTLVWSVWTNAVLQGGIAMALVWAAWFSKSEAVTDQHRREMLLSSLVGMYVCLLSTLVLRGLLPFRARPAVDPAVTFHAPFLPSGVHLPEATSFPSGHAAILFSLAIGLWLVSRTLGTVVALHGFFVVCLPRVYFGRHYATDILAGTALAIAIVPLVAQTLRTCQLTQRLVAWSYTRPAVFYSIFFIVSLDVATDFAYAKTLLHVVGSAVGSVRVTKIAMSVLGVVMAGS